MAYKFQVGSAVLSGSTKFEEELDAAGGLKLSGVGDTALDVSADSFLFRDADGTMKRDTMADYATAIAGDGLAASSGVLAVGVDDSSIELNSDALRIKAAGVTDAMLNDDVATGLAGVGLSAASGVMALDLNELTAEAVASGDFLAFVDSTDNGTHKETVDDLATLFAGAGLAASSAVLSVQVSGALKVASDKVGISGSFAGDGIKFVGGADSISGIEIDLNELPAAAVAVGADSIAIIDADDNTTKKESIADLMTAAAGDGIVAGSGVLSIDVADMATSMTGDIADADEFAISDGGTMKKVDFSVVRDAVFADVSGDATVAAGGALTIAADSVEGTMLNTNAADGTTMELSSDSLSVLKVPNALSQGDGITAFSYDGSGALTVALSASVGGEGLGYSSGVLSLDMNELTAADLASGDFLAFVDSNDSNKSRKESIDDVATLFAGAGLAASSAVLSVQVSGAVKVASDKIGISGSFAGAGLSAVGGADSISSINVQVDDSTIEIDSDLLRLKDDGVTGAKLAPAVAGDGLKQDGSGNLELDLNELPAATVAVASDSIAIIDSDDNTSKKESIADLVGAMAGSGLVAASGVLSTRMDVTTGGDADYDAAFGLNINSANYTAPRTVTLPTANAADAGRMLVIKARNADAHTLTIARNGSDVIDGTLTSLSIESINGAVTLLCAGAGNWIIV